MVLVTTADFHGDARRGLHVAGNERLHVFGKFAKRCLVRRNTHGYNTLTVAAVNLRRAPVLFNGGQLFQFDLRARGRRNGQILKVADRVAVFLFQADDDAVLVAVLFQEAHRHTVHAVAHVGGHCGRCQAVQRQFFLVNLHVQFGAVLFAAHLRVAGALNAVVNHLADFLGQKACLVEIVAIYLNVNRLRTHTARCRAEVFVDFGILLHFLAHNLGNLENRAVAVVHFRAAHNH